MKRKLRILKRKKFWAKLLVIIAGLGLLLTTFLPFLSFII